MTKKSKSGLGECGCCEDPYDGKERFAVCNATWSGRLFPSHPESRSLKQTLTWSYQVQKRWIDPADHVDKLWPSGTVSWLWSNLQTNTINKWTNEFTLGTPALSSGSVPTPAYDPLYYYDGPENRPDPIGIPFLESHFIPPADSTHNPLPAVTLSPWGADNPPFPPVIEWTALDVSSGNVEFITNHRWDWSVVWVNRYFGNVGGVDQYQSFWGWASMIAEGMPYFKQTVNLRIVWSLAGADVYHKSQFASDWAALYAKLNFETLLARKTANEDFHFATYHYNSSGQIVERYYVENTQSAWLWRDRWELDGGEWFHNPGLHDALDLIVIPMTSELQYTEIVGGGAESAAVDVTGIRTLSDSPTRWVTTPQSIIELPHSTYCYLERYVAPVGEEIDGLVNLGGFYFPDGRWMACAHALAPEYASAIARITIVPLPAGSTEYALRRYRWTVPEADNSTNPDGCCHPFINTNDSGIKVQNSRYTFEFVRDESCGTGEQRC